MRRELEIQAYVWNATTGGEGEGFSGCRSFIRNLERDGGGEDDSIGLGRGRKGGGCEAEGCEKYDRIIFLHGWRKGRNGEVALKRPEQPTGMCT